MAYSYPIWNNITACIYKSNKSYGVRREGVNNIYVGSSAINSHHFAKIVSTHRQFENGDREFRLYVDKVIVKRAILKKGETELLFINSEEQIWNQMKNI